MTALAWIVAGLLLLAAFRADRRRRRHYRDALLRREIDRTRALLAGQDAQTRAAGGECGTRHDIPTRPFITQNIAAGAITTTEIAAGTIDDPDGSLRKMTDDFITELRAARGGRGER
jgi:hypothetical protein